MTFNETNPAAVEWMVLLETYNLAEAQVIAGRLEADSIPVMVHQEAAGRALGITVGALGEIKVLVHPADYERALDLIAPDDADELPDSTADITYHLDDDE
jgi:hypothetical protein